MTFSKPASTCALMALCLFGCKSRRFNTEKSQVKVFHGTNVQKTEQLAKSLVFIKSRAGNCSGTAITRAHVLSAAHCAPTDGEYESSTATCST